MSLTRAEWLEMWKSIKYLEEAYDQQSPLVHSGYRRGARTAIKDIKKKIQQVVGQLETDPRAL